MKLLIYSTPYKQKDWLMYYQSVKRGINNVEKTWDKSPKNLRENH